MHEAHGTLGRHFLAAPNMPLTPLKTSLDAYEVGTLSPDELAIAWRRALLDLGPRLPAPLARTAEELLMRVESARWFAGEACGFSSRDLAIALRRWLEAADQALPPTQ